MFHFTFLRHGESIGNFEGRVQGQSDYPLTDKGQKQALDLAACWQAQNVTYDWIISSPLSRARQTAEIISAALGLPVQFDPTWEERGFGELEGMYGDDIHELNPDLDFYHPYHTIGQTGESMMDLYIRGSQAVQKLIRGAPGRYLVVAHGAILNMTLYSILGIAPPRSFSTPRFQFGNTTFAQLTYDPERRIWRFLSFMNNPRT